MSDYGKLCYQKGGSALCYQKDGSSLVFKVKPPPGNIYVMIVANQSKVGPIKSCGVIHSVFISPSGSFTQGSGSFTVGANSAGQTCCTIKVDTKPATIRISCTTESSGCAYPEENPSMGFKVSASQDNGGASKQTSKSVSNVATGSFTVTVTVGSDGKITEMS